MCRKPVLCIDNKQLISVFEGPLYLVFIEVTLETLNKKDDELRLYYYQGNFLLESLTGLIWTTSHSLPMPALIRRRIKHLRCIDSKSV